MIATTLLLKALRNRHDEWEFQGGAGGSRGMICASAQTRCLAVTGVRAHMQVILLAGRVAARWSTARQILRALHCFFRN